MTERHPLISIPTALLILAISVLVIGQLTYPWRGAAAGVVLATCSGALIWFAKTRRHAVARSLFSIGTTAVAAPAAGLSAAQNDFIFNFLDGDGFNEERMAAYEHAMDLGVPMLGVGAAIALVMFVVGWRLHRTPKAQ